MDYTPRDRDDNGRVTMARIGAQLENLTREVRELTQAVNRRIDYLEEKMALDIDAVRGQCHENKTQIARLDERQKSTTNIQTALTLVLSSIAATIGALFK